MREREKERERACKIALFNIVSSCEGTSGTAI